MNENKKSLSLWQKIFRFISWTFITILSIFFLLFILGTNPFILQTIFSLLFGWVYFLGKVIPYASFNPAIFIEGIIILIIFIFGVHQFLSWLTTNYHKSHNIEIDKPLKPWRLKWTIAGVSIFFLTFTISISLTGLIHEIGWLTKSPFLNTDFNFGGNITERYLNLMGKGLEKYYAEHQHLPIVSQPVPWKELKIPKQYYDGPIIDQWGNPILYSSDGRSYTLRSYGKNGILGGGLDKFDDLVFSDGKLVNKSYYFSHGKLNR